MKRLLLVAGLTAGCGPVTARTAAHRPSLLEGIVTAPIFESPAQWQYHPRAVGDPVTTTLVTASGKLILAGRGERWWQKDGALAAADDLAPESLIAAVNAGPRGWLFVGEGGATYQAATPLGTFSHAIAPPERLVRVAVSEAALIGLNKRGELLRTTDWGASWSPLSMPARVADVALLDSGEGLILTVPEQLYYVHQFGDSIEPAVVEPFGALLLETAAQRIRVRAILQSRYYEPGAVEKWTEQAPPVDGVNPELQVPLREDAEALADGRAVRTARHYFELLTVGDHFALLTGETEPVGAAARSGKSPPAAAVSSGLRRKELDLTGVCPFAKLGGDDAALYIVCSNSRAGRIDALRFLRSVDGGRTFHDQGFSTRGDIGQLEMTTLGAGELVVAGVCPVSAAGPGCRPTGVHLRVEAPAGPKVNPPLLRPLRVPGLNGLPLAIAAGARPGSLVVAGRRSKGDELTIFISNDGGKSFRVELIDGLRFSQADARADNASLVVESLRTSQDGYTGVVVYDRVSAERSIVTLDDRGKWVSLERPPSELAKMASSGLHALALDVARGDAWESTDGGGTWASIGRTPVNLCESSEQTDRCDASLFCHDQGCAVGSRLSRIGWNGQASRALALLPPLTPALDAKHAKATVQTPITCTFEEGGDWARLAGGAAPDANRASLGGVQWFTYVDDFRDASLRMFEAVQGHVRTEVLFAPDPQPLTASMYASLQVEGVVGLRFQKGRDIDLVWRNLFEGGQTHRVRLPSDVKLDSSPTRRNARLAAPDLVTVASGGVFVRPERGETKHPSYFVAASGTTERILPFDWAPDPSAGRNEFLRIDGQNLGVWFMGNGAGIVRAAREEKSWALHAAATGLLHPRDFEVRQRQDIVYTGAVPGLGILLTDTSPSSAWVFPFNASGPVLGAPLKVATQARLPAQPRTCAAEERARTPRILAPSERGTRHPVLVTHATEPVRTLLTDVAVIHGTEAAPCVEVYDAAAVELRTTEELSALVRTDASDQSWLFRKLAGAEELEYRSMRCVLDSEAEVPSEVYSYLLKNP